MGFLSKFSKESPDYWIKKANALDCEGKRQEAIKFWDKALELDGNNVEAMTRKGYALYAPIRCVETALQYLDRALQIDPDYYPAIRNKAAILTFEGRNTEAILFLNKAITIDPEDEQNWRLKGQCLRELKRYEKALSCIDTALAKKKNQNVLSVCSSLDNKGLIFEELGRYQDALQVFDKILKISPGFSVANFHMASVFEKIGEYDEALRCYDRVIRSKSPTKYSGWFNKGMLFSRLGRYYEAIYCIDKAMMLLTAPFPQMLQEELDLLDKVNIKVLDPEIWVAKGIAFADSMQIPEAVQCLDVALKIRPDFDKAKDIRDLLCRKTTNQ